MLGDGSLRQSKISVPISPSSNSLSVGQVLQCPYDYEKARLIVKEMIDLHALDLFAKGFITDQIVLDIGYDIESLTNPNIRAKYHGEVTTDHYGRKIPKHAHGTTNLKRKTSSAHLLTEATMELYDRIVNKDLLIRRINIAACKLDLETNVKENDMAVQLTLFDNPEELQKEKEAEDAALGQGKAEYKEWLWIQNTIRQECHSESDEPSRRRNRKRQKRPSRRS